VTQYLLELKDVTVIRRTQPSGLLGLWGRRPIRALGGVGLGVAKGETLGIIGGSGAGQSTLLQVATLRLPADRGQIFINGHDMTKAGGEVRRKAMRRMPVISQDPREDLKSDRPVARQIIDELRQAGLGDADRRCAEAFATVGLTGLEGRIPRELSGGQVQRAVIARALACNPAVIACDEPFSGVDLRLQEELADILLGVQQTKGVSILLVSHNLHLIRRMSRRVAVMHRGVLFEEGEPDVILGEPKHPYSTNFLRRSQGPLPAEEDPTIVLGGCPWFAHCSISAARCRQEMPTLRTLEDGRRAACHEL
jgi:peptide/nickel transport system ATP-binding protein